jgi:photosystem II stability/assembly factor-like uncharacterized protein
VNRANRAVTRSGQRAPRVPFSRFIITGVAAVLAVACGILVAAGCGGSDGRDELLPVASIEHEFAGNHLHGIGYDYKQARLFLATHFGLFVLQRADTDQRDWRLFQVGTNRDDFMGFSLHPLDPDVIFTSGHPARGGNLGVMKSEDGGFTFKQVFDGPDGEPIDFHSMTISPADPAILYGYYWGDEMLYRTRDAGRTWDRLAGDAFSTGGLCWGAPCLAADPNRADSLYAGTERGLMVSHDGGETWRALLPSPVAGVGVSGGQRPLILAMSATEGVVASTDDGTTWERRDQGLDLREGELVFAFSFDWSNPQHVFLATTGQRVFQSTDGGESWIEVMSDSGADVSAIS